jgi:ATP-dependent Clp protease ATP-binding subunit ClpX
MKKPSEGSDALRCSFCHKSQDNVAKLISSPSDYPRSYICDECIFVCQSILDDEEQAQSASKFEKVDFEDLLGGLNAAVVGQEQAIRQLALIVRAHQRKGRGTSKANVLLAGPSGCGKSFAMERVSEAAGLPYAAVNALDLFISDGGAAERICRALRNSPRGVISIENLERIADRDGSNPEGRRMQRALLTILHGTIVEHVSSVGRVHPAFEHREELDTSSALFAAGFDPPAPPAPPTSPKDLVECGFIPEFAACFVHMVPFEKLNERGLLTILKAENSSLVRRCEELFQQGNFRLEFSDSALNRIAQMAAQRSDGAHSLPGMLESAALQAAMECGGQFDRTTFVIDEDFIRRTLTLRPTTPPSRGV